MSVEGPSALLRREGGMGKYASKMEMSDYPTPQVPEMGAQAYMQCSCM
jgi:hypothetical protein